MYNEIQGQSQDLHHFWIFRPLQRASIGPASVLKPVCLLPCIRSDPNYWEMLPNGVESKKHIPEHFGTALK